MMVLFGGNECRELALCPGFGGFAGCLGGLVGSRERGRSAGCSLVFREGVARGGQPAGSARMRASAAM